MQYYFVFGGELDDLDETQFRNIDKVDLVGLFATREEAQDRWKAKAFATVDNAMMRYFIMPLTFGSESFFRNFHD